MIEKIQIMHKDVRESLNRMPFESVGRLFMALMAYANDEDYEEIIKDDSVAFMYFPTLQEHLDRMEKGRVKAVNNGSKGGAPKGNSNARKDKQEQAETSKNNLKQPKTSKNKQKQTPILSYPIQSKNKKAYGECANVFLTDEEYQKIIDEGLAGLIEELSLYIASKGDKYKSHYAVIKQWANRRKKEQAEKTVSKPNQFTQGVMRTEIDFSELEKRLIKN